MGPVRRRIATGTVRATMQGSLVGGVSAGSEQALINLLDGNPTTGPLDGVLTATLFGGSVGGLVGRVGAVHQPALARPGLAITRTPTMYEATVDGFYVRGIRNSEGTLYLNFRTKIIDETGNALRHPSLRGKEQFDAILAHFGRRNIQRIVGIWSEGDNLATFNHLTARGVSPEKAALQTWTGQRAIAAKFGRVTAIQALPAGRPGHYQSVTVYFER